MFLDHPGIEKPFLRDSGCLNDSRHMFRGNLFLKNLGGLVRTCFKARARRPAQSSGFPYVNYNREFQKIFCLPPRWEVVGTQNMFFQ